MSAESESSASVTVADPDLGPAPDADRTAGRLLLLAAIPAVIVGIALRYWIGHTRLLALNSDEALIGLQAREVLNGTFRLIVAGNDYGATTESYLLVPLLPLGDNAWPIRILAALLSAVAAYALFRLARPFLGRAPAICLGLILWTVSGALVIMWSRPYLGYPTGVAAEIATVALAADAMRSEEKLTRTALLAGFAAGFAIWSHPMFGTVALLALLPPTVLHIRRLRNWWAPVILGGVVGVSPWLFHLLRNGSPRQVTPAVKASYLDRLQIFFIELLPRGFGLRLPGGQWLAPSPLTQFLAVALILGSLAGLVLLAVRQRGPALPVLVAGVLAFPALALFPPLAYAVDARYALPFMPLLLMGLGSWLLVVPAGVRNSPWLVVALPTVWSMLLCVPVLLQQTSFALTDPERGASAAVRQLEDAGVHYLRGDYWATYLMDYLAGGRFQVRPDGSVRLGEEANAVLAANPDEVALVYRSGVRPKLLLPAGDYRVVKGGGYEIYLPPGVAGGAG